MIIEPIAYWNLVTGDPAQQAEYKRAYFELEVVAKSYGFSYATNEGEFLCSYGSEPTFGQAWIDALTYTTIGGSAYQEHREHQATKATVYDDGPFDPYAGNLDELLGY